VRRIGVLPVPRLSRDRNNALANAVNAEDRRTGLPCALLCTALRVAALNLQRESARFCGKSASSARTAAVNPEGSGAVYRNPTAKDMVPPGSPSVDGRSKGLPMSQSISQLLLAYIPLVVFIGVAAVIGLALLASSFLVAYKQPDPEKLSAYECGFNAFDDARMKFDVRFYLVAILFIIFDLEVTFLFPWAATFGQVGVYGFWAMMVFLAVLTIGFIYEWKKGALEWD
jgi:NADH-quinone oxidoreductase subunit A